MMAYERSGKHQGREGKEAMRVGKVEREMRRNFLQESLYPLALLAAQDGVGNKEKRMRREEKVLRPWMVEHSLAFALTCSKGENSLTSLCLARLQSSLTPRAVSLGCDPPIDTHLRLLPRDTQPVSSTRLGCAE